MPLPQHVNICKKPIYYKHYIFSQQAFHIKLWL